MILQIKNEKILDLISDLDSVVSPSNGDAYFVKEDNKVYSYYKGGKSNNSGKWSEDNIDICEKVLILDSGYTDVSIHFTDFRQDKTPRIKALQINKNKHFHAVDHNTELTVSLEKEDIYGEVINDRALLIRKEYKHEGIDILKIEYFFSFGVVNDITHKRIVLSWYNNDGTINVEVKDKGNRKLSKKESRTATRKRRETAVLMLEYAILDINKANTSTDAEYQAAVDNGASMLSDVSVEIGKYENSGRVNALETKLNSITGDYPMLLDEIQPSYTILQYIVDFLNY